MNKIINIGILPYKFRKEWNLAKVPLFNLRWLDQEMPDGDVVADLAPQDHVIVFPSYPLMVPWFGRVRCNVDLLFAEPLCVHGIYYKRIWLLRHKFCYVLCRYDQYVARYSDVIKFIAVSSMVNMEKTEFPATKTRPCSLIASSQQSLVGHKLRHRLVDWIRQQSLPVDVMGRGCQPFENKEDGLLPYHYSVIIENSQEQGYFTEKLLDCMLCCTFPIYWGAPDIGDYFDMDGIHFCRSESEIKSALETIHKPLNQHQLRAMRRNRRRALVMKNSNKRAIKMLRKLLQ